MGDHSNFLATVEISLFFPRAYANLCADHTPMVRRAAASHLKEMIECCTPEVVDSQLRPLFLQFVADDQVGDFSSPHQAFYHNSPSLSPGLGPSFRSRVAASTGQSFAGINT